MSRPDINPLPSVRVTSRVSNSRTNPVTGIKGAHQGVDLGAPTGTPVYATQSGRVESAGWNGGYGNLIEINHGGGYSTRYAHLSRIAVRDGQPVNKGDVIGYVGSTGRSTGPHLHYEVRVNGVPQNAENYLNGGSGGTTTGGTANTATPEPTAESPTAATTATSNNNDAQVALNVEPNILNNYRSLTYNIALGVLPANATAEQKSSADYRNQVLNAYHILDSSGKSGKGPNGSGISTDVIQSTAVNADQVRKLVEGFNESSPGRYDMFIDDLVVYSLGAGGDTQSGATTNNNVKFTVIEPYSMGGFIEALEVAALAAGWNSYQAATYIVKIWFMGYLDSEEMGPPEIVPTSTRYFDIQIRQIDLAANETGTTYKVEAIPYNELGYGIASIHYSPFQSPGNTVFEVLRSYFDHINTSVRTERERIAPQSPSVHDYYEIYCPVPLTPGVTRSLNAGLVYSSRSDNTASSVITAEHNDIARANMPDANRTRASVETGNARTASDAYPGQTANTNSPPPATGNAQARTTSFSIPADQPIHQAITNIILTSDYISRDVLREQANNDSAMLNYFKIRTDIDLLEFDRVLNRFTRVFKYIIEPFKISKSVLLTNSQGGIDYTGILREAKKQYNYLYTGKNLDVIKFNIELNNMALVPAPAVAGNNPEGLGAQANTAPTNPNEVQLPDSPAATQTATGTPAPPGNNPPVSRVPNSQTPSLTEILSLEDPYTKMAAVLHDNILNTRGYFSSIDLEILGDPYYLANNRLTNRLESPQQDSNGQAPIEFTEVFINLIFRTPEDVYKGNVPGLADFGKDGKLLPFSGIFKLNNVESSFKNGVFTQKLNCLRYHGQILENEAVPSPAQLIEIPSPVPGAQVREDSADPSVNRTGITRDSLNLSNLLNRGFPSIFSDFTGALDSGRSLLTQTLGATARFDSQLGVDSGLPSQNLTAGIVVSPSALNSLNPSENAAGIASAGDLMNQVGGIQDAGVNLAGNVVAEAPSVGTGVAQEVEYIGNNYATSVGGVSDSLQRLQNPNTSDPSGIASKLGIDTSVLAGVSPQIASRVTTELTQITKLVPPNTSLGGLANKGVALSDITEPNIPNLPPLQPERSAPRPIFDPARVAITDSFGNVLPLLNGKTNLPALTEANKVKNSIGSASSGIETVGNIGAVAFADKVGTAQAGVNGIISKSAGVTNGVGSVNQNLLLTPSPASINLGSVESNFATANSLAQTGGNVNVSQQNYSVTSQLGSRQTTSPLTTLVDNYNKRGTIV